MKNLRTLVFSAVLLVAGTAQGAETIRANAIQMDVGARKTSFFSATLERYSTDEERAKWREAFAAGGQDALVAKWQDENPSVGHCSFTNTTGYRIRAAISVPTDKGGRKIYMATDRPMGGFEYMRGTRSQDYPIGWIEVEVDAEGKGEGRLIGAMQFAVEGDKLVMKTYGTEPIRLINVVVQEK
jgi:hypothetical protein